MLLKKNDLYIAVFNQLNGDVFTSSFCGEEYLALTAQQYIVKYPSLQSLLDDGWEVVEPTLYNLTAGDFIENEHGKMRILAASGYGDTRCYLISYAGDYDNVNGWHTAKELENWGNKPYTADIKKTCKECGREVE